MGKHWDYMNGGWRTDEDEEEDDEEEEQQEEEEDEKEDEEEDDEDEDDEDEEGGDSEDKGKGRKGGKKADTTQKGSWADATYVKTQHHTLKSVALCCVALRRAASCRARSGLKQALRAAFAPYRVKAVKLPCNDHCQTLGWAFVSLYTAEGAGAALAALGERGIVFAPTRNDGSVGGATHVLRVSRTTDKRDMLFPRLPAAVRVSLELDAEAFYSVTDQWTADRLAELCVALARVGRGGGGDGEGERGDGAEERDGDGGGAGAGDGCGGASSDGGSEGDRWIRVTDGSSCVGGNAIAFARAAGVARVRAVEFDAARAGMLARNAAATGVGAGGRVRAVCDDFVRIASADAEDPSAYEHIYFLDPPWGGPSYREQGPLDDLQIGGASATLVLRSLGLRGVAGVVCMRAPADFEASTFARAMVALAPAERAGSADAGEGERLVGRCPLKPFPFKLRLGRKSMLLVACFPRVGGARPLALSFTNAKLDAMVCAIRSWNARWGQEHHPRFFDWEKDAWIPLSRWRGFTGTVACKTARS
eukprot:g7277.t1